MVALVGNGLGQGETAEAAHRLGFVEEILHRGVAEVVAELDAVAAQHHRQRVGPPSPSRLGVVRLDAPLQLIPGHKGVEALEEQLTPGLPLLLLELHAGERRLMHGAPSLSRSRPMIASAHSLWRVVQTVPRVLMPASSASQSLTSPARALGLGTAIPLEQDREWNLQGDVAIPEGSFSAHVEVDGPEWPTLGALM